MKRLLMISYPFPPNASAGAVRSDRFARYLTKYGWDIDVVTINRRSDSFQDEEQLSKSVAESITVHSTKIFDPWLWLRSHWLNSKFLGIIRSALMRLTSFPDHMIFWVPIAIKKGLQLHKQKPINILYSTSPPHSTHLAGIVLARLTGIPWVVDFRDPWTLNASREKNTMNKWLLLIEQKLETAVLKTASVILANTKTNRNNLLTNFQFPDKEKVQWLPNGWERWRMQDLPKSSTIGSNHFTIVHAGTFYPSFQPYGLLYALGWWRRNGHRRISCELIENKLRILLLGANDSQTKKVVENLHLEDIVEIRPRVSLSEARCIMRQADLLWASLGTDKKSASFIPSKIFEYIAARKPIIGFFPEGEASNLINATGTGKVFHSDEPQAVIEFIDEIIGKSPFINPEWYCPKDDVIEAYHIGSISRRLSDMLDELVRFSG